jgi:hypothetical protein
VEKEAPPGITHAWVSEWYNGAATTVTTRSPGEAATQQTSSNPPTEPRLPLRQEPWHVVEQLEAAPFLLLLARLELAVLLDHDLIPVRFVGWSFYQFVSKGLI